MTQKTLFLVTMRAGSHLLGQVLSRNFTLNIEEELADLFVDTVPARICPLYTPGVLRDINSTFLSNSAYPFEAYIDYVGDGPSDRNSPHRGMAWNQEETQYYSNQLNLKIVHFMRDPRDQLASLKRLHYASWDPEESLLTYVNIAKFRMRNALSSLEIPDIYMLIPFQDLVQDTKQTLARINNFTKIPLNPEPVDLKTIPNNSSFDSQSFCPVDTLARWKTFSREERLLIDTQIGEELRQLGFANNNEWIDA